MKSLRFHLYFDRILFLQLLLVAWNRSNSKPGEEIINSTQSGSIFLDNLIRSDLMGQCLEAIWYKEGANIHVNVILIVYFTDSL